MGIPVNLCRSSQPLPAVGEFVVCDGCGRSCSRLMQLQCQRKGPPDATASPDPVKRFDWRIEHPCAHRGAQHDERACGCCGVDIVPVYDCRESPDAVCVVLKSNRTRLARLDGEKWAGLRACEDCPLQCPADDHG